MTVTPSTSPDIASSGDPSSPFARVARARLREQFRSIDRVMIVIAAVLLPLGIVMIFLGWYGAARTPYLFEQVPYLLSGGLLGLGLALTGGFVLFGSWIAQAARDQRVRDLVLLEAVREVRDELARLPLTVPESVPAPPAQRARRKATATVAAKNGHGSGPSGLVATARGSMLHRPDCAIVSSREDVHLVDPADADGLQPCRLCAPLAAQERTRA